MDDHRWANATLTTIRGLQASGANVEFLSDTPIPKQDVPTCLASNLNHVAPCELTRKNAYGSALYATRHQVMIDTLRAAGVRVVDPVNWLCSSFVCPVVVGNHLVYRDSSHMTNTYSQFLWPMVLSLFSGVPTSVAGTAAVH